MRLAVLIVIAVAAASSAEASGRLDTVIASIELENGQTSDCAETLTSTCLVTLRGDSVGSLEVNATQRFSSAMIATNGKFIRESSTLALLPDETITINASDVYLRQPVLRVVTEEIGGIRDPTPFGAFWVQFDEGGFAIGFVGPGTKPISTDVEERNGVYNYSEEGIGYEQIGPFNNVGAATSTDIWLSSLATPCRVVLNNSECEQTATEVADLVKDNAPNVATGWAIYDAGVMTYAENLWLSPDLHRDGHERTEPKRAPSAAIFPLLHNTPAGSSFPLIGGSSDRTPQAMDPIEDDVGPSLRTRALESVPPERPHAPALVGFSVAFALAVILAALYSRITRDTKAIVEGARGRMLQELQSAGPLDLAELSRRLGYDRATVEYHARVLAREALAITRRASRRVIVALPGQSLPRVEPTAIQRIGELIQKSGSITREAVAHTLPEIPTRTQNHALQVLERRGLIRRSEAQTGVVFQPTVPQ